MAAGAISVGELEATLRFKHNLESELAGALRQFEGLETAFDQTETALADVESAFQSSSQAASQMAAETIAAANDVANAFASIGGAASAGNAELAQVTGLVTAAIDEYRKLGVEAPANLQALATATQGLQQDYSAWSEATVQVAEEQGRLFVDLERVNELARQFGGAEVIRNAEAYAASVQKIGGATRLTADEQRHVNQAVGQALDKFRALGQEAPQHLIAIERETRSLVQDYGALHDQARKVAQAHGALFVDLQKVNDIAQDFGGADAIRSAEEYAAAVEKVGGVARLTEAEQARVNATVAEAIEKFRALGREAPQHLQELADATRDAANKMGDGPGGLSGNLNLLKRTLVAVGFASAAKEALNFAGQLSDLSQATGISIEGLQRLDFAGRQVGVSLEQSARAVQRMQRDLVEALRDESLGKGLSESAQAIRELGLNAQALSQMAPDEMLLALGKAIRDLPTAAQQTEASLRVLGRSAGELIPLLTSDIDELTKGFVGMSDRSVESADRFDDAWSALGFNFRSVVGELIGAIGSFDQFQRVLSVSGFAARDLSAEASDLNDVVNQQVDALTKAAEAASTYGKNMGGLPIPVAGAASSIQQAIDAMRDFELANRDGLEAMDRSIQRYDAYNEEVAELAKQFTGKKLAQEVKKLHDAVKAGEGAAKMSAFEHEKLGERLEEMVSQGAKLTPELNEIRIAHLSLSDLIPKVTVGLDAQTLAAFSAGNAWRIAGDKYLEASEHIKKLRGELDKVISTQVKVPNLPGVSKKDLEDAEAAIKTFGDHTIEAAFTIGQAFQQLGSDIGGEAGHIISEVGRTADAFGRMAAGDIIGGLLELTSVVIGLGDALTRSGAEKAAADVRRQLGLLADETDETIQRIADRTSGLRSKLIGEIGRPEAITLALPDLIEAGGGVTVDNFNKLLERTFSLLNDIQRGGPNAAEGIASLDRVFGLLGAHVEDVGGIWDREFTDLIRLSRAAGLELESLDELIISQLEGATGGLTGFLQTGARAFDTLREKQAELAELQSRAADAGSEERAKLLDQITDVTEAIEQQKSIIQAAGVTSQQSADAFGASIAGIFASLLESGRPIQDVVEQITPAVQALETQLAQTGLTGGAAFDSVRGLVALLADEVSGPVLQGVIDLDGVLVALQNTGLLNQDIFAGLTGQITQAFDALVSQGKDGDQVLRLLKGPLQTVYELQQDFGFAVDESTQALLDQAEAAGLVGEKAREPMERLITSVDKLADAVDRIAQAFGVLPRAADNAASGIESSFRDIEIDVPVKFRVDDLPEFPSGGDIPSFRGGSGGVRDFGEGTLAVLHGREAVVPEGDSLGTGGGEQYLPVIVNVDGLKFLEVMARVATRHGAAMPLTYS